MAVIVTLTGSATDDGRPNPPGALTYQWSKISGPGTVEFADAADPTTTATISDPGVYVLRLTASDSALFDMDDVTIQIFSVAPDFGLVEGQQDVVGIGSDGFLYRTNDFQTPSGSGGPTWVRFDLGIAAKIYSWVVDPFSPGYLEGVGEINGWIVNDTDIYRVEDLFGTPIVTSVHTFAVETVGASNHWRTIQASFGAYYAEGLNPWLVCVTYYGGTLGHSGTWAIRSEDGGTTWSEEVQISLLYDGITDIPESVLPTWALYNGATIEDLGIGPRGSIRTHAEDADGGAAVVEDHSLWLCPQPGTKRVVVSGQWTTTFYSPDSGTCDSNVDVLDAGTTTLTDDLVHSTPGPTNSGVTTGSFIATCDFPGFAAADWPVNNANFMSGSNANAFRFRAYSAVSSFNPFLVESTTEITVRVTEIELDDGTIYYPDEGRANPIAVWTSPRTPGKVYTAAHVEQNLAGAPVWAVYQDSDTAFSTLGVGMSASCEVFAEEVGGQPGTATANCHLIFAPPVTTKRVLAQGIWQSETIILPSGSSVSGGGNVPTQAGVTHTDDEEVDIVGSGSGGVQNGTFTVEWTFLSGDWPVNDVSIVSSPPTHRNQAGGIVSLTAIANTTTGTASTLINLTMRILELELDDGTIYYPSVVTDGFVSTDWGETWVAMGGNPVAPERSFAGTIHVPWPDNQDESLIYHGWLNDETTRQFQLKKVVGGVASDVSPSDVDRSYGINRGPFSVRTFDGTGGQQFVLAAVIGNDASLDPADDFHAVYISDDNAATWAEVVAPIPNSAAPTGRPAFEAAFGGDEGGEQILFIWGPANYIAYSSNFGVAVDDRSGNLDSFGTPEFIGIAGGPTGV